MFIYMKPFLALRGRPFQSNGQMQGVVELFDHAGLGPWPDHALNGEAYSREIRGVSTLRF